MCYTTTLCIMEDNIKNVLMIMIIIIIKMAKSARNDELCICEQWPRSIALIGQMSRLIIIFRSCLSTAHLHNLCNMMMKSSVAFFSVAQLHLALVQAPN